MKKRILQLRKEIRILRIGYLASLLFIFCSPAQSIGKKTVDGYITTTDRSKEFAHETIQFNQGNLKKTDLEITINPSVRYQVMDGFGAAITGSTCYNLMQMAPQDRTNFLKETFSPDHGVGFSYVRISIGCSDFSLSEYTCCDTKGIKHFALQEEESKYIIPVLKEILKINPSLKILGSPWTCPRWMKVKDLASREPYESWTSGQLNPDYYSDYAAYFVKWIQAFKANGISIYSITPQNEPLNRQNSASLFMGWKEQQTFIKTALGPQLKAAGLKTKIYAFDHNYNYDRMDEQLQYPLKVYEDKEAAKYLAGAAYHNYGGEPDELNVIHDKRPDKELVFTETSIGQWNDGRNLQVRLMEDMREVALGTVNNWCKGVIVWNLMLDSERGPNRKGGCRSCYGAVDIDKSDYKTIIRNSHYYAIGHLSSVVKPGAVRIASSKTAASGLIYSAFVNADGTYAFVVLNDASENRTLTINDGKKSFITEMPAHSVASYRWNK